MQPTDTVKAICPKALRHEGVEGLGSSGSSKPMYTSPERCQTSSGASSVDSIHLQIREEVAAPATNLLWHACPFQAGCDLAVALAVSVSTATFFSSVIRVHIVPTEPRVCHVCVEQDKRKPRGCEAEDHRAACAAGSPPTFGKGTRDRMLEEHGGEELGGRGEGAHVGVVMLSSQVRRRCRGGGTN